MTEQITIKPIGIIHSPYREHADIPIQGRFKPEVQGWVELDAEYQEGLQDLSGFSHAYLVYYFHDSDKETLTGHPFLENQQHGIFAIRSPHRPNHIGISVVEIKCIEGNCLTFTHVDMLDGTPLLDIKPYVTHFDCFPNARSGWIDKFFADGDIVEAATNKKVVLCHKIKGKIFMNQEIHDPFFGRMNDPTSAATICGPCGDEMEFYLVINDDVVTDVRYYTRGCGNTRSCGAAVSRRAKGQSITEALSISAGELITSGDCKPEDGRHCAILAVSTLYRAIADYLLQP